MQTSTVSVKNKKIDEQELKWIILLVFLQHNNTHKTDDKTLSVGVYS